VAGPSPCPHGLGWAQPKKINKKKYVINMNLLFLFIDARVRIKILIQIYFIIFYLNYIKIKKYACKKIK
jgi:hypothetical protein